MTREIIEHPSTTVWAERLQLYTKHSDTFSLLSSFRFVTSKMKVNYYYQKLNVLVASKVAKQIHLTQS